MSLYRFTHISPLQITSTSRFPEMLYHNSNALHHKVGCYFGVSIYGFFKGTALGTVSAGAIIAAEYFTTGKDLFKLPETIEENFQDSVIAAISIAPIVGSIMMLSSIPRFQFTMSISKILASALPAPVIKAFLFIEKLQADPKEF